MSAAISSAHLRRRIAQGARVIEIARELGVSRKTVKAHCRAHGIALPVTRPGPLRRSPPLEQVLTRLAAGETAQAIARSAGVARPTIIRCLERGGYRLSRGVVTPIHEVQS